MNDAQVEGGKAEGLRSARPSGTQALENAMTVLFAFSDADRPLGVTELANKLGVHKSTISRQLSMLSRIGFVTRSSRNAKYALGMGLLPLAASVLAKHQLSGAARLHLEALARKTGEVVTYSGWDGRNAVNLDQIGSRGNPEHMAPPGRLNPAHCTATGKVFLAELSREDLLARLAEPLARFTEDTICDAGLLAHEIAKVREHGFAVSRGEFIRDVFSIATPMKASDGRTFYALAVTLPVGRATPDVVDRLAKEIRETAQAVSALLPPRSPEAG